jgi:hypothetical protein
MPGIESLVQNSQKLTTVFGAWPSFHDAELVDLHFWRGDVKPGDWDERNVFPVLTVKIRVLEATQPGATCAGHDILTTLRFHDVDDFKMDGFNHSNMIVDLSINTQERGEYSNGEKLPPYLVVQFERCFGIRMSFRCFRIEVVDVTACQGE